MTILISISPLVASQLDMIAHWKEKTYLCTSMTVSSKTLSMKIQRCLRISDSVWSVNRKYFAGYAWSKRDISIVCWKIEIVDWVEIHVCNDEAIRQMYSITPVSPPIQSTLQKDIYLVKMGFFRLLSRYISTPCRLERSCEWTWRLALIHMVAKRAQHHDIYNNLDS